MVVLLHDLGMPFYTLQHAEKSSELADEAAALRHSEAAALAADEATDAKWAAAKVCV